MPEAGDYTALTGGLGIENNPTGTISLDLITGDTAIDGEVLLARPAGAGGDVKLQPVRAAAAARRAAPQRTFSSTPLAPLAAMPILGMTPRPTRSASRGQSLNCKTAPSFD